MGIQWISAALFLLCCCFSNGVQANELPTPHVTKLISIDDFMARGTQPLPLKIRVPLEYEHADVELPLTYSVWMPSDEVQGFAETKAFPVKTGWMYGKISLNTAYRYENDSFSGQERLAQEMAKAGLKLLELERKRSTSGHPLLFVSMLDEKTGVRTYNVYIATLISTNVLFVAYRPANHGESLERTVWEDIKASLLDS